jgi:nitrogen fixation protein FixH
MKKFHFGHGITIVLLLFIAFLLTALYHSIQMDHTLVAKDYYAGDLAYQKTFEKIENAITYKKEFDLKWNSDAQKHFIQFSDDHIKKGSIKFYRPSDSKLDFEVAFDSNSEIEINELIKPGKWTITAEWAEGGIVFQVTKIMVISV